MSDTAVFDALARTLADAQERFGATAFTNRRRLIGLLADHVPDARREIRAVGTAIDEGVPGKLRGTERHLIGMEMDRQAERLDATTGLRLDIAKPVVRGIAYALGLGPLPSVYVGSPFSAPPPPPRPADDWRGVSESVPNPSPSPARAAAATQPEPAPTRTAAREDFYVVGGRAVSKQAAWLGGGAVLVLIAATQLLGGGDNKPAPSPTTISPTAIDGSTGGAGTGGAAPTIDGQANAPAGPDQGYGRPLADGNYADETTNHGIPPRFLLQSDLVGKTPINIPGGRRITTAELQRLLVADSSAVLLDVLDGQHARTVRGAKYLPGGGAAGTLSDQNQVKLETALAGLTGGDKGMPIVFFCFGAECWESYNAVLRAAQAKYTNLYWYRGGIAAWGSAGLPMDPTPAPVD